MNFRLVINIIAKIVCAEAVFMIPALLISLYCGELTAAAAFISSMLIMAVAALPLALWKPKRRQFYARDGFVAVGGAWVFVSLFGALPLFISGAIPNFLDAFFESVAGFTTTGASILTNVEVLPKGILYWCSFTHWLGGMGVLLFVLAMGTLSRESGNAMHLLRAESPGPNVGKLVPRMSSNAKILYGIYILLTVIQIILLIIGDTPLFDSVTLAFATAGTGGFSIRADNLASYTPFAQNVVMVFMVLCGINFNIYYLLIIREAKKSLKSEELRVYLLIIIIATAIITANIFSLYENLGEALRHSAFQVAAMISSTGFSTANYDLWPEFSKSILMLLMVVGACAGSTGGGLKVSRVIIIVKSAKRTIVRALRPNSVKLIHMDGELIEEDTTATATGHLTLYVLILAISTLVISLDDFSLETNFTAVLACLGNTGSGFGEVVSTGNFAGFSVLSKFVLCFNMLAGRLEIFPMLALFTPSVWKK